MSIPPSLVRQFELCKQQLIIASTKWQLFEQLFAKTENRSKFLKRTGSGFFGLVRDSLVSDVMISVGRLLDKASQGSNENLSLNRIICILSELNTGGDLDELLATLNIHLDDAIEAECAARAHRNKRLAHSDLKSLLNPDSHGLPPVTLSDIRKILSETASFLNAIEHKYLDKRTVYGYTMIIGDANDVVKLIRDGMIYREQRLNRHRIEAGLEPINSSVPNDA